MNKEMHKYRLVTEHCFNPFFLECDGLRIAEINSIKLYDKDGIKYSARWFDAVIPSLYNKFDITKYPIGSNNGFRYIILPYTNIPVRRKEVFDKKEAYIMIAKKTFFSSKTYDLYLNIDSLTGFHAQDVVFDMNLAESRIETRVIFKLRGMLSSTFAEQKEDEQTVIFNCDFRYEDTDMGVYCRKISKILDSGLIASTSQIEISNLIKNKNIYRLKELLDEFVKEFPEK